VKQHVLAKLKRVVEGLESGSLDVEMYHDHNETGHSEMNVILMGDFLCAYHRVHLVATEDWPTHLG